MPLTQKANKVKQKVLRELFPTNLLLQSDFLFQRNFVSPFECKKKTMVLLYTLTELLSFTVIVRDLFH